MFYSQSTKYDPLTKLKRSKNVSQHMAKLNSETSNKQRDVVILAGGRGTRIAGLFPDISKPLIPVAGKPFLHRVIESFIPYGAKRFILAIGHKAETYSYLPNWGKDQKLEVILSKEDHPLGSAGAVAYMLEKIHSDEFFVINGDTILEADLSALFNYNLPSETSGLLGVCSMADCSRYGAIDLTPENQILRFIEKGYNGPGYVNAGIMLLKKNVFTHRSKTEFASIENDIISLQPKNFLSLPLEGKFIDIGIPSSFAAYNAQLCFKEANSIQKLFLETLLHSGRILFSPDTTGKDNVANWLTFLPVNIESQYIVIENDIPLSHYQITRNDLLIRPFSNDSETQIDISSKTSAIITTKKEFLTSLEILKKQWIDLAPSRDFVPFTEK